MSQLILTSDTISDEDVERLNRLWWVPLIVGIAWTIVALSVLQFDVGSVRTISLVFGVLLIAAAINEFADVAIAPGWKWLHAVFAGLFLVGGVATLVWPDITFLALANLVAWFLMLKGTFDVVLALSMRDRLELWGLTLAVGVLELVVAFWAVGYDGRSAALLILWVGLGALAKGITNILSAFQIRWLGKQVAAAAVAQAQASAVSQPQQQEPAVSLPQQQEPAVSLPQQQEPAVSLPQQQEPSETRAGAGP